MTTAVRKLEPVSIRRRAQLGRLGACRATSCAEVDGDGQGGGFDFDHGLILIHARVIYDDGIDGVLV